MSYLSFEEALEGNWKAQMASIIKSIELRVADVLSEGREPFIIVMSSQTAGEIIHYSAGPEAEAGLDWREPITLDVGEGGAVKLRILRTPDLKRGQIIIE